MTRRLASLLGAAALLAPAAGQGQVPGQVPGICGTVAPGPFAYVIAADLCTNLSPLIRFDVSSGLFQLAVSDLTVGPGVVNDLTATFKPDPFISFGTNTSNLTPGPTTYTFIFGTPIVPGFYSRATSTGGVSVTSGAAGSATVAQAGGEEFINVYGSNGPLLTSLGVDIGTGTCTAGAATNTCEYPPPDGGPAENEFGPMFLNNLEVVLTYTQTDVGSQVGWTGRADVYEATSVVPEPATVGLVLTGLVAMLGGHVVRRRRAS